MHIIVYSNIFSYCMIFIFYLIHLRFCFYSTFTIIFPPRAATLCAALSILNFPIRGSIKSHFILYYCHKCAAMGHLVQFVLSKTTNCCII